MRKILCILLLACPLFGQTTHTTASQEGNNAFTGNNTHAGTETFNNGLSASSVSVSGNTTLARIFKECWVDGVTYANPAAVIADSANCSSMVLPPGYTFAGDIIITRSSLPIFAAGPVTITGHIKAAGTVNGVSLIGNCGISSGANQCFKVISPDTSPAIQIGDSSNHSKSLLVRGVWWSVGGNGAVGLQINNLDQYSVEDSYCSLTSGTAPICVQTDGTGTFVGSGAYSNVHLVDGGGTNDVGYQFKNGTTTTRISGGNVALDLGSTTVCVDVQGATTTGIKLDGVHLNTCHFPFTVESSATLVGALTGNYSVDSGIAVPGSFASGTQGNQLKCTNCTNGTAAPVDAGSNNGIEFPLNWQINGKYWQMVQTATSLQFVDKQNSLARLAIVTAGDTLLDPAAASVVRIGHNSAANGLSIESSGTAKATIDGTGAAVFNASLQVNGGTVLTGTVGAGTKIASNTAVQTFEFGCTGTAVASNTVALNFPGIVPACTNTTVSRPLTLMSTAGTLANLRVQCNTAGTAAGSGVFTVFDNGGATALTCTVGTGTTCNDTTHLPAISAAHELTIKFTTQATETLANCEASVEKQ